MITEPRKLKPELFADALKALRFEVLVEPRVAKLDADLPTIADSLRLIEIYSLNATDAAILQVALDLAAELQPAADDLLLVTSDQRLLRAANAEGLKTFNPEIQSQSDLQAAL